jgi:hypothetical protein
MDMQGVSLSTASSMDVKGVSISSASSMDVQDVSLSTTAVWACRVYPFPPEVWMLRISLSATSVMDVQGVSLSTTSGIDVQGVFLSTRAGWMYLFHLCKVLFKCRNAGLICILLVRYRNEQICRCRNQSGTGIQ